VALAVDLREVAHAAQQAVRDTRRAAAAPRDDIGAVGVELDLEQARRARDDAGERLWVVEVESERDAEAREQRTGDEPGAGGGATSVKRGSSSLTVRAAGPCPMTRSMW
jgi:hypothetical protein